MSEKDLKGFLLKVSQLNKMIASLGEVPGRRELLVSCKSHDEVVELAKSWGYEIDKRWGEY